MTVKTSFWKEYLKRLGDSSSLDTPRHYKKKMNQATEQFVRAIETYQQDLANIPLGAEIETWLQDLDLSISHNKS